MAGPLFHVVLHEPEIPNNTGNIGRTCVAAGCALHLIRPLGFDTSEKAFRRAGLDYWPRLDVREHDNWASYLSSMRPANDRIWIYTTKCARPHWDVNIRHGDHLIFGKETAGLPGPLLEEHRDRLVTLPMSREERSLNLATVACTAVYEGLRQLIARGEISLDAQGRLAPIAPRSADSSSSPRSSP